MDMLKNKETPGSEIQILRNKLKNTRDQNSILSDQLQLLQKECKDLLSSISTYEEVNHKLSSQVSKLNEKNTQLKKKLRQSITACSDIKKQAEAYISSLQTRFYEQMARTSTLVTNKKDSEEIETSYSVNSFNQPGSFRCDSPAISVSERENDSSIARFDSEEIILAYTQEIKDKQTEISNLNKNLERKTVDIEDIKLKFSNFKENYEKKIQEKERLIYNYQQEIKSLKEELGNKRLSNESFGNKLSQSVNTKEINSLKNINEDYSSQIESLQAKLNNQSKKFENYIRTIANLEKQIQLQMIKYSELENSYKGVCETAQNTEADKKVLENKLAELEMLKIQQAKVINEQSAKINNKSGDEGLAYINLLKTQLEDLKEDNKKLLEANEHIQEYGNNIKKIKENEIKAIHQEMNTKFIEIQQEIQEKNEEIFELTEKLTKSEEII